MQFVKAWKALAILSDTTARGSAVDWEDLKPYWKSEKMPHFPRWSINLMSKVPKTFKVPKTSTCFGRKYPKHVY